MPLVRFMGTSNTYNVQGITFEKNGDAKDVDDTVWRYLQGITDHEGKRQFAVADAEPEPTHDEEMIKVLDENRVGAFLTKEAAIEYAARTHGVHLSDQVNLQELNEQTALLYRRRDNGLEGNELIEGLRGARLPKAFEQVDELVNKMAANKAALDTLAAPATAVDAPAPESVAEPEVVPADSGEIDTAAEPAVEGKKPVILKKKTPAVGV